MQERKKVKAQAEYWPISDLTLLENNPRTIKKDDMERLKTIIKNNPDYFEARPVIISNRTGKNVIIAGNQRLRAAEALKMTEVPAVLLEGLTAEREQEIIIRDNVSNGEWDVDELANSFDPEDLDNWGVDLAFPEPEVEVEEDEAPEVNESEPADSELGKVYQLGEHRLMCGDSTDAGNVTILMDGQKADMVFTDPPYNMGYTGAGFLHKGHVEHMQKRLEKIIDFDANSIAWLKDAEIPSIFIFTSKDLVREYLNIFADFSYNILIWHKTGVAPFKASSWIPDIEYLLYFHKKGHKWNANLPFEEYSRLYSSTIKEGRQDAGGDMHPTIKPLSLICRELKICSDRNDSILDLFGGSGSTLIACEQLGRKCYMMELDPKYCDVIRKRYWKFKTGSEDGWEEGTK